MTTILALIAAVLGVLLYRKEQTMKVTKVRLITALNIAKNAKADVDAAKAAEEAAKAELVTVTAERDSFKDDAAIVNDGEVVALVDELVPAPEPEPEPTV